MPVDFCVLLVFLFLHFESWNPFDVIILSHGFMTSVEKIGNLRILGTAIPSIAELGTIRWGCHSFFLGEIPPACCMSCFCRRDIFGRKQKYLPQLCLVHV